MRKLMFISLACIIPFCKAADDVDRNWSEAVEGIPNWKQAENLDLEGKNITTIPGNLIFPNLKKLNLASNDIKSVDPLTLSRERFPKLELLDLSKNPLTEENVYQLREAVGRSGPVIMAFNLTPQLEFIEDLFFFEDSSTSDEDSESESSEDLSTSNEEGYEQSEFIKSLREGG